MCLIQLIIGHLFDLHLQVGTITDIVRLFAGCHELTNSWRVSPWGHFKLKFSVVLVGLTFVGSDISIIGQSLADRDGVELCTRNEGASLVPRRLSHHEQPRSLFYLPSQVRSPLSQLLFCPFEWLVYAGVCLFAYQLLIDCRHSRRL